MPNSPQLRSHIHHGSSVPMFGAITNNYIDPSVPQSNQGAHSQAASQHFSLSPGSQANFSIQHNSSNGATHQLTYQSSLTPELEAELRAADAFYEKLSRLNGCKDDSSSTDFPEKQPVVVDTLQTPCELNRNSAHLGSVPAFFRGQPQTLMHNNSGPPPPYLPGQKQSSRPTLNSHCATSPHQSHEHQPMDHHNPLDPNIQAPHDASHDAACSQAVQNAPVNGTSDQCGVNAQSYQESMPQTQTEPSKTKKRQRSKAGGSNGETSKKRKTATRSETVDWVATAYMNSYQGMTAEAAEERLTTRIPMDFAEKDDLEAVVDNKEYWIRRLISAFDKQ